MRIGSFVNIQNTSSHLGSNLLNQSTIGIRGGSSQSKRSFINNVLTSSEKKNWKFTGYAEMIAKYYDLILVNEKINQRRRWRLLKTKDEDENYTPAGDRKDGRLTDFYGEYEFKHKIKYRWLDIFVWDRLIQEMELKMSTGNGDSTLVIDNYHGIL